MPEKTVICLWFDTEAEEAARALHLDLAGRRVIGTVRYGPEDPPGGHRPDRQLHGSADTSTSASTAARSTAVQRGDLLPDPVRRPGRGRPLLGPAHRRRRGVRSAAGSRTGSASPGRSSPPACWSCQADPDPDRAPAGDPGHVRHAQARHRRDLERAADAVPATAAGLTCTRRSRQPLGSAGCRPPRPARRGAVRPHRRGLGRARPAGRHGRAAAAGARRRRRQRHVRRPAGPARARRDRRRPQRRRAGHPPAARHHRRRRPAGPRRPGRRRPAGRGPRRRAEPYDLALCHSVLEVVDDPAATLRQIAAGAAARAARSASPPPTARAPSSPGRWPATRSRPSPCSPTATRPGPGPPGPPPVRPRRAARPGRAAPASSPAPGAGSPSSPTCSAPPPVPTRPRSARLELALAEHLALPRRRHRPARPGPPPGDRRRRAAAGPARSPATGAPTSPTCCPAPPPRSASPCTATTSRPTRCELTDALARRPPGRRPARRRPRRRPAPRPRRPRPDAQPRLDAPVGDLTAPCPSTTPVSLTTLGTGLPPGSHGVLGFVTAVPGEDRTLNHIHWGDDPDPRRLAGPADRLRAGRRRRRRGHRRRPLRLRRVRPHPRRLPRRRATPARSAPATSARQLCRALAAAPRSLVYGYIAELDLTGHVRGVDSACLARPARRWSTGSSSRWSAGLPDDAALLVTADHGMLDVPAAHPHRPRRADPSSPRRPSSLAGEPRARYVHAEPGAADDVLRPVAGAARRPGVGGRPRRGRRHRHLRRGRRRPRRPHRRRRRPRPRHLGADRHPSASPARAGWPPTTARSPRPSSRSRCCSPAGARSAEPSAQRRASRARSRECAGCTARQVSRPASADGPALHRDHHVAVRPGQRHLASAPPRRPAAVSARTCAPAEVVDAEQPELGARRVLRRLRRRRHARPPAQPRQRHPPVLVRGAPAPRRRPGTCP